MLLSPEEFPNSKLDPFTLTSPIDFKYNCIAWAYGINNRSMWSQNPWQWWPPNILDDGTINSYVALFESLGYAECQDESVEINFQKIALYTTDGTKKTKPEHAAKQLPSGLWTSKLGQMEDVTHSLNAMDGGYYGKVAILMKKPIVK